MEPDFPISNRPDLFSKCRRPRIHEMLDRVRIGCKKVNHCLGLASAKNGCGRLSSRRRIFGAQSSRGPGVQMGFHRGRNRLSASSPGPPPDRLLRSPALICSQTQNFLFWSRPSAIGGPRVRPDSPCGNTPCRMKSPPRQKEFAPTQNPVGARPWKICAASFQVISAAPAYQFILGQASFNARTRFRKSGAPKHLESAFAFRTMAAC